MRSILTIALFGLLVSAAATATDDHYVNGYTKKDGTYVHGHYQTDPNSAKDDNYSTRGNESPHTGKAGIKPRDEDEDGDRQGQRANDDNADDNKADDNKADDDDDND
ncbi:MAG TPA: hypothetical protein VGT79_10115 [Xanthomonadaceae bacterium]|nr:hypothetical protein [Xanthomonadaceae bacterium]